MLNTLLIRGFTGLSIVSQRSNIFVENEFFEQFFLSKLPDVNWIHDRSYSTEVH